MADKEKTSSRRPFVIGSYLPNDQTRLRPRVPNVCPEGESGAGGCCIVSHGWRPRKTGPFSWLKLFRCLLHGIGFTVYPQGMVPFARRSFIDNPNYFEAAVDAEQECKWPHLTPSQGSTFKTQKRHVLFLSKIFGVDPSLSETERVNAAVTLNVSTIHLREGAAKIREGQTYKGRAQVVMGVLAIGCSGVFRLAAILRQGHAVKLWRKPIMDERDVSPALPSYHLW